MTEKNERRVTDELREYVSTADRDVYTGKLLAIADRIDAEHERQLEVLYRDMSDAEYVELPKDADGEVIHIGDVMGDRGFPDAKYTVVGIGKDAFFTRDASGELHEHTASLYIHYKQPTIEDVLQEFAGKWLSSASGSEKEKEIVAEYAAKLQLREEA